MTDEYFMKMALKEAERAFEEDEVPVGAIVVINNKIISRGYNMVEKLKDPTAHAEIIALTSAFNSIGSKYLPDATLYVTVEPCLMCAGAIYWSQLGRLVYGASEEKRGFEQVGKGILHPKTEIVSGVLANESEQLLREFFSMRR